MEADDIKLFLSIWGAGLSTILGILTIIKYRRESRTNLLTLGYVDNPFEEIRIEVCNKNKKPATIKGITIGIGTSKGFQLELVHNKFDEPPKLSESDIHFEKISQIEIREAIKNQGIEQREFQRLWLNVILSTNKMISEIIYINPEIIEGEYYLKAEQFIACDLFLGFKKMDSKTYPIGLNK